MSKIELVASQRWDSSVESVTSTESSSLVDLDASTPLFGALDFTGLIVPFRAVMDLSEAERSLNQLRSDLQNREIDSLVVTPSAEFGTLQTAVTIAETVPGVDTAEWLTDVCILHITSLPQSDPIEVLLNVGRDLRTALGEASEAIRLHVA